MSFCVCNGALLSCSFGVTTSPLMVTPENKTASSAPLATTMDYVPMKNIMPFGMCNSMVNPQVAAATTAALGVLTPMPCIPNVVAPWAPGNPNVLIANKPLLNNSCKANCLWGGVIQITNSIITNIQG